MKILNTALISIEQRPVVVGVPDWITVEYLGQFPGSAQWYVILRPTDDWDYDSFFCLSGEMDQLRPWKINKVVRYSDGGTTEVSTECGDFYFPTCFKSDATATFNGRPITVIIGN